MEFKYDLRFFTQTYDDEGDVDDEKLIAEFETIHKPIIPRIGEEVFFAEHESGYRVADVCTSYQLQNDPEMKNSFIMIDVIVEDEE